MNKKLTSKLLLLLCIFCEFSSQTSAASKELVNNVNNLTVFAGYHTEKGEAHTDCDDESCSKHYCHFGHCVYTLSRLQFNQIVQISLQLSLGIQKIPPFELSAKIYHPPKA